MAPVVGESDLPRRFGSYVLIDKIGEGGMAEIFLAHDSIGMGAHKRLVVKQILPILAQNEQFCQLLVNEAKLSAKLSHPNVVQVFDLGREEGSLYIAMEYIEGIDLRQLLRNCAKKRVSLPLEFAIFIVEKVLEGLDYAHAKLDEQDQPLGIVHRDVSPSNVLLSLEGEVKLCDFGIARALGVSSAIPDDAVQGKAGYMSPEAASGENIDARADLFSAGIILWELLSGRRLYKGEKGRPPPLELAQKAEIPELQLASVPGAEELVRITGRALSKDLAQRYQSAHEMRLDLQRYLEDNAIIASPLRFGRWLREQVAPEVIEQRRSLEKAVLASPLPEPAAENTDHSGVKDARSRSAATPPETAASDAALLQPPVLDTQPAVPVAAAPAAARSRTPIVFLVVVVIAFAIGVLLRLR
jgi:serine/threonine-protein kinase